MAPSRPPLTATLKSSLSSRDQTLSSCTAKEEMQRCCPRSHTRMVWSLLPETHMVPAAFSASALQNLQVGTTF